ncbi:MAG: CofH family radical SAM protein [Spirochaetes bacterium]|nr:CofH family radical SAM protein [Spirochaetota bacterium]
MNLIRDSKLISISEKVEAGIAVSDDDAFAMLTTTDIMGLAAIAHKVKMRLHGSSVFYGVNMNLNYTNICTLRCPLCAFSRNKDDNDAYLLSLDAIAQKIETADDIDEVHIVGGLHPDLPLSYYEDMLKIIKSIKPALHIVAFTAVEYDYMSKKFNIPLDELFQRLRKAGLGSIPGGGAEIFAPEVRGTIAPKKISGTRWLEVMAIAHRNGIKTNATMLFNHIENEQHIIDHIKQIRTLQDETGGFKTFVPLVFHQEHTGIKAKRKEPTGFDIIRIYATARIYLHNVPHIKALWMYVGEKLAQVLLQCGVDDIGATYYDEKVVHSAGAKTPAWGSEAFLQHIIKDAGFIPVRVNASYIPTT